MEKKTYRNSFYNPEGYYSREFIDEDPHYEIYKGYQIHKYTSQQWHIVKDGVCIGMMAGIEGAKRRIDGWSN